MLNKAIARSEAMGELRKSITNGEGNIAGFLGEEIFLKLHGGFTADTFDYDILLNDIRFEIKTKCCKSKPLPDYECTVSAYNVRQKTDYYSFVRLLRDGDSFSKGYFLGCMSKCQFFNHAKFIDKGERDGGFVCKAACFNVFIKDLTSMERILEGMESKSCVTCGKPL